MADETYKHDLASLSMTWSERVKTIRNMAKHDESGRSYGTVTSSIPDMEPAALADDDLFAEAVPEQLSVHDLFAGSPDLYKTLQTVQTAPAASIPQEPLPPLPDPVSQARPERSQLLMKILAGCLAVILVFLVVYGGLSGRLSIGVASSPEEAAVKQTVSEDAENEEFQVTGPLLNPDDPASLKIAGDYYREGEYLRAAAVYRRLLHNLPESTEQELLRDYFLLNIALCVKNTAPHESAKMLKKAASSHSPIVRVLANYHLSLLDMQSQQFLSARMRAYQAAGLAELIDFNKEWSRDIKRNCYFLGARAVTQKVLALSDADKDLPSELWPNFKTPDNPLLEMDERTIQEALKAGSFHLNKALLEPKIAAEHRDDLVCWTLICKNASIEEILTRFATTAGYDVQWKADMKTADIRNKSVNLYLPGVDDQQLLTVAAGSVGLLAYSDDHGIITICNPMDYSYASDQLALLRTDAVSCWQKYLHLFYNNDEYLPNAHFALGILKTGQGLVAEALTEFKIIPARYLHSKLGPGALTQSAALKAGLHDFRGAYNDLKEAVEQYSDHDNIEQTYLALGAAAVRIGNDEEAAKLYSKVYYLNHSIESQIAAAFSAGTIFYQTENFEEAEQWLTRYVNLVEDQTDQNLYQGCLLLGKTWQALGNYKSACKALRSALRGRLSQQDYIQAVTALVDGYLKQERFVEAYEILNQTDSRQLAQADAIAMLLLKSLVLREMGLTDKAITLLTEREEYLIDDIEKSRIGYELSECYLELGQTETAYKKLATILEQSDSGPLAHQIALKLTDVCQQLGLDDQALRVGSELLSLNPDPLIEEETRVLLAAIYQKQEKYDRAALVLMGQWQ